jgi:hypothetical protein
LNENFDKKKLAHVFRLNHDLIRLMIKKIACELDDAILTEVKYLFQGHFAQSSVCRLRICCRLLSDKKIIDVAKFSVMIVSILFNFIHFMTN